MNELTESTGKDKLDKDKDSQKEFAKFLTKSLMHSH